MERDALLHATQYNSTVHVVWHRVSPVAAATKEAAAPTVAPTPTPTQITTTIE